MAAPYRLDTRGPGMETPSRDDHPPADKPRWSHNNVPLPRWALDPDWLATYGRALPLVVYLCERVSWEDGTLIGYRHRDAADHLGLAVNTVAQQFRLLRESGVLRMTMQRGHDGMNVALQACDAPYQKMDREASAAYQKTARKRAPYQKTDRVPSKKLIGSTIGQSLCSIPDADANASDTATPVVDGPSPSSASGDHPDTIELPVAEHVTERDRWLTKLRDASPKDRLPILVDLAHDKLGISTAHIPKHQATAAHYDPWGFVGQLARKHTASLVATAILQAGAQAIDGDPLKYVAAILERKAGTTNGYGTNRQGARPGRGTGRPASEGAGTPGGTTINGRDLRYSDW